MRQPPLCRHDHRVKGEAGWQLRRIGDTFEWTTRLGHVYVVPVPRVLPILPAQDPSAAEDDLPIDGDRDARGDPWERSTAWDQSKKRQTQPEPPTPPRPRPDPARSPDDPDLLPPF